MNKLFLIFLSAFMLVSLLSFTQAAIAFDNSSNGPKNASATSLNYTHTMNGINTILFVGVSIEGGGADLVTGVTYNGVSMTHLLNQSGNGERAYLYYIQNPASGTHNVVVSTSSGVDIRSASVSYTGVAGIDNSTKQTLGVVSPATTTLKTLNDSSWMISYAQGNGGVITAGGNTTLRNQTPDKINAIGDSNGQITPPKVFSMSWIAAGTAWNIIQASIYPLSTVAVTLNSPSNNSILNVSQNPVIFNATITNTSKTIANVSLLLDGSINITNTSGLNGTYIFSQNMTVGNHFWNVQAVDTNGVIYNATNNFLFSVVSFSALNITYNQTTYQTKYESYNLTINTSYAPMTANFVYNGTIYPALVTNLGNGNYTLSENIDVPIITGNISFYYLWTTSVGNSQSIIYYQGVNPLSLVYCTNPPYLNFTFADESNQSGQFAYIPASTFTYWLGSGTQTIQYLYSNPSSQASFSFCLTPSNLTLNTNWSISYQNTGYPIRTYINTSSVLTNITFNKTLYMLAQSNGIAVTFQVVNPATQPLSGVFGTATGTVGGTQQIVGSGVSGADGGITFFVNPLLQYTFTFSKTGYTPFTLTTTPAQSSYTITLGGNSVTQNDYTKGISYTIYPSFGTILNTSSNYYFNFTLNSTFWTVSQFGYVIYDQDGNVINSTSSSNSGGNLFTLTNTTNDTSFTMNYFYLINGTYTNGTIVWTINTLTGTQYSIYQSFLDLGHYLTSGNFYGLTPFGLGIIMFVIIFITTGTISWKFGYTSPMAVIGIVFAQVLLYDVGLGLIPNPVGAIPHFPTVAIGLIIVGMIFRERTG